MKALTAAGLDPTAALTRWFGAGHRWTDAEVAAMGAALDAPTTEAALDVWFDGTCRWRDDPGWAPRHIQSMTAARAAGGVS